MTARERVVLLLGGPPARRGRLRKEARALGYRRFAVARGAGISGAGLPSTATARAIGSPTELRSTLSRASPGTVLLLAWRGDRVIPLESAIARRPPGVSLWVVAGGPEEVPAALGALEHGAEVAVVRVRDAAELRRLERVLGPEGIGPLAWTSAVVERVVPVGLGDRVLVDTVRLLRPWEGLLVGSSAAFLFHVGSEAVGSRFSPARPFRVNAGSAHSYVLRADGSTRYLAELGPAEPLALVGPQGSVESVRIGRVKIERRPLVLVEARVGDERPTVFLQEAETVRLVGPRGPVAVTDLRPGDRVRGVRLPPARHLGDPVPERVEER